MASAHNSSAAAAEEEGIQSATASADLFGVRPQLWAPVLVLVHVLAACFLVRVVMMVHPMLFASAARDSKHCIIKRLLNKEKDLLPCNQDNVGGSSQKSRRAWPPVELTWQGVACAYKTSNGMKQVLKGIAGDVQPGTLCALMGPSGAGKSTLLDILAARKTVGDITGEVLVNGAPRRNSTFTKMAAYVPQDAHFLPTLTVQETCTFYAKLMLPEGSSPQDVSSSISGVLGAMGLRHTTKTLVGGVLPGGLMLRGLSGGERKRLSIATALLSDPAIVFLDEPTSGLDSFAALSVTQHLRDIADESRKTVIASIHQPGPAIWTLFDGVVLLSQGHLMYAGVCEGLVPWFSVTLGYAYDHTRHGSASDWVMDLVNIGFGEQNGRPRSTMKNLDEVAAASKRFLDQWQPTTAVNALTTTTTTSSSGSSSGKTAAACKVQHSPVSQDDSSTISHELAVVLPDTVSRASDQGVGEREASTTAAAGAVAGTASDAGSAAGSAAGASDGKPLAGASWLTQLRVLFWRELLSVTRNPVDVAGRMLVFAYCAVMAGLFFYNLGTDFEGLHSRVNLFYVEALFVILLPYVYMSLYTADKRYFMADASAKLYSTSAYYVAKQLAVLPFNIFFSASFVLIVYGMAGLRWDPQTIFMHTLVNVMLYLVAAQVMGAAAVVTPNQDTAFMLAVGWTAFNSLACNYVVRIEDSAMSWLQYFRWLSSMGYGFAEMLKAEFTGTTFSCSAGLGSNSVTLMQQLMPNTAMLRSSTFTRMAEQPGQNCVLDPGALVEYFGAANVSNWRNPVCLLVYLGVLHVVTYLGLVLLARKERR